jgi:hypothetical protein
MNKNKLFIVNKFIIIAAKIGDKNSAIPDDAENNKLPVIILSLFNDLYAL